MRGWGIYQGFQDEKTAADIVRIRLIGQSDFLFGRKRVIFIFGVVFDIAARCLIDKPFADVSFGCVGFFG